MIIRAITKAMLDMITADWRRWNSPAPRPTALRMSPKNGMRAHGSEAMATRRTHFGWFGAGAAVVARGAETTAGEVDTQSPTRERKGEEETAAALAPRWLLHVSVTDVSSPP